MAMANSLIKVFRAVRRRRDTENSENVAVMNSVARAVKFDFQMTSSGDGIKDMLRPDSPGLTQDISNKFFISLLSLLTLRQDQGKANVFHEM